MLIEAVPIDPPAGDLCYVFRLTNDSEEAILSVLVESIDYEWGDFGNGRRIGSTFGPIAPGESVEFARETATEVRTSVTLRVRDSAGERRLCAEFGRLYAGRELKTATVEVLPSGTS